MVEAAEYRNDIHLVLKDLIDMKSRRDNSNFSLSQLAKAIGMPHSILSKLTHFDPTRRVSNPRIDTLTKIVNFFRNDGFAITIDDLLEGFKDKSLIRVDEQKIEPSAKKLVPLFFLDCELQNKIGTVEVDLMTDSKNLIAFVSDEFIEPIFKKGSIFIIDTTQKPESGTLVAVQISGHEKILIRKLYIDGNKIELKHHDHDNSPLSLMPTMKYRVLGVVIQANVKT